MTKPVFDAFNAFLSRCNQVQNTVGPLAGLRLCVKDNISVQGQPYTSGHPTFSDRRATTTAPVVSRFLASGAHFVGMTYTDSGGFGMTSPGVKNPVNCRKIVGGSSGGTAAAIAGNLADIGLGTDTGGSIRVPAACTGLFGYKPSFGRVETTGVDPLAPDFDHIGLMARNFDTICTAARVLISNENLGKPLVGEAKPLTFAIEPGMCEMASPEIAEKFFIQIELIKRAGHVVENCKLPDRLKLSHAFGTLVVAKAWPIYQQLTSAQRQVLGAAAQSALSYLPEPQAITTAELFLNQAQMEYNACCARYAGLLSPTLLIKTPDRDATSVILKDKKYPLISVLLAGTCPANLLGAPAITLPDFGVNGANLHLMTKRGDDEKLFSLAAQILQTAV